MNCDVGEVTERLENEQSCDVCEATEGFENDLLVGKATEWLENEL